MADRKVRRMSPTAVKTYMMLLHEAFVCETRPNLPDDDRELESMAFCETQEEWMAIKDEVLSMFEKSIVDGVKVLTRKRLVDDWNHLQEIREKRAEAGKEGAEARWGPKDSTPIANATDQMANDSTGLAKNSKEGRKEGSEENNQVFSSENSFQTDGQEGGMKIDRRIDALTQNYFGRKAFLRGRKFHRPSVIHQ